MPAKRSKNPDISRNAGEGVGEISAAERAYANKEIRQGIIQYLHSKDLARWLRVNKHRNEDYVIKKLYQRVPYKAVQAMKQTGGARQRLYLAAITIIDACEMTLTVAEMKKIGITPPSTKSKNKPVIYGKKFNAAIFDLIVPALRRLCPSLRIINFGRGTTGYEPFEDQSWVVECYPQSKAGKIGHIEHRSYLQKYMSCTPTFPSLPSLPSPSTDYSTSSRFDIELVYDGHLRGCRCRKRRRSHQYNDEWLADLENGVVFGALYRSIDLGPIPVGLEHLARLYERQELAGQAERLETIIAPALTPWEIPSFRAFALTAGAWLTSLILLNDRDDYRRREGPLSAITLEDLPNLISIIKNHLPKLSQLDVGLKGDQEDEVKCLQLLTADALQGGGGIDRLRVFCGIDRSRPFNIIRYLSCLCSSKATIYVGDGNWAASAQNDPGGPQTRFLRYLRAQSSLRKAHLSVFDFTTLKNTKGHIVGLNSAQKLEYDETGRVLGRQA